MEEFRIVKGGQNNRLKVRPVFLGSVDPKEVPVFRGLPDATLFTAMEEFLVP